MAGGEIEESEMAACMAAKWLGWRGENNGKPIGVSAWRREGGETWRIRKISGNVSIWLF